MSQVQVYLVGKFSILESLEYEASYEQIFLYISLPFSLFSL